MRSSFRKSMSSKAPSNEAKAVAVTLRSGRLSSSTAQRVAALKAATEFVEGSGADEPGVLYDKFTRLLVPTLQYYHDRESRLAAASLVAALVGHHGEDCAATLAKSLASVTGGGKGTTSLLTKAPNYHAAASALEWTCTLVESSAGMFADGSAEWAQITAALGGLLAYLSTPDVKVKLSNKISRRFNIMCGKILDLPGRFVAAGVASGAGAEALVLAAKTLLYLRGGSATAAKQQEQQPDGAAKTKLAELYVKCIVPQKEAIAAGVVAGANGVLKTMSHDDFKGKVLEAVKRGMKRSASVAVPCTATILASVELDLSQYAATLSAMVAEHFKSPRAEIRDPAVAFVVAAAARTSDSEAATTLLARLVGVLNGKDGRLTLPEQKSAAIAAISAVASAPVRGAGRTTLCSTAVSSLLAFSAKEPRDETVVEALGAAAAFIKLAGGEADAIPASFAADVKKAVAAKKTSNAVRGAYFRCLCAAYNGDTLEAGAPLFDEVVKYMEKAPAPNAVGALAESSAGAAFALSFAATDEKYAAKIKSWPMFKASNKSWSKLAGEDPEIVLTHVKLTALVFGPVQGLVATEKTMEGWVAGFVAAATHPSYPVRTAILKEIVQIMSNTVSVALRDAILKQFFAVVAEMSEQVDKDADAAPPTVGVVPAFLALAGTPCVGDDAASFATSLLVPSHNKLLLKLGGGSKWTAVAQARGLDLAAFLEDRAEALTATILDNVVENGAAASGAVATLCGLYEAQAVRDRLLALVFERLGSNALASVSERDVGIAATAEGKTYDEAKKETAVIDNLNAEIAGLSPNSKDYEEKKWELTVKRDLELKKRAAAAADGGGGGTGGKSGKSGGKGGKAAPKLNKHDADRRAAQLKKEQGIREKVASLRQDGVAAGLVLRGLVASCGTFLTGHLAALVGALLKQVHSAVFAAEACALVDELSKVTSPRLASIRSLVCFAMLRSASPADGSVPAVWMHETLSGIVGRAMRGLWAVAHDAEPLDYGSFAYCWPLISYILEVSGDASGPAVLEDALVFLSSHGYLGACAEAPRLEIVDLLIHVLHNQDRLAHQAGVFLATFCSDMAKADLPSPVLGSLVYALQSPMSRVRRSSLDGLAHLSLPRESSVATGVWITCHDVDEQVKQQALVMWQKQGLEGYVHTIENFYAPLGSVHGVVRTATAAAFAAVLAEQTDKVANVVEQLIVQYEEALVVPEQELDHLGQPVGEPFQDPWFMRAGYAALLEKIAPLIDDAVVPSIFRFFVQTGLHDPDSRAGEAVLAAAQKLSDVKGKASVDVLLPIFEHFLETAERQRVHDIVRQSAVVLLGALAKHLEKTDPKIPGIIDTLLATLSTPSEEVQKAVALCISPLVAAVKPSAPAMIEQLLELLLEHDSYGTRRGAAHGLAGIVKGMGILALKKEGVTEKLKKAIESKKNARWREGALMAYEMLCTRLGRLFEPYVVHILPNLLVCFGDGNKDVRQAANDTAAAIMGKLSSHGVKLVLPHLLKGLDDMQWRTKQGSAQLLGAMAFCAPKQLSTCLPSIVPQLSLVLTDSHVKVQASAKESLEKIGSVIRNPEIQDIVHKLLAAINQPNVHTNACLQTLLETAFVHVIDAPSLALIMPILERAITGRSSTSTTKMASQIIGNMYSLTDPKDLAPYLPKVLPGIKSALIDPEPSVRGIAAKALGSMMKGMGEATFPELVPWLLETLKADGSSVDRSGAAQGLSEVLLSLGMEKLDELIPEFITGTNHQYSYVREGHMLMFVYLPVTFQESFMPYVERVIPIVLRGIADIEEGVRSTAMRAGTGIINNFSEKSIELLLPELEVGILDENWRIRESSVNLLGELLYKISGLSGKKSTTGGGEDDNFGTEASTQHIVEALGQERNDRVLAGLYMCRQDTAVFVRQAANHVWKSVVEHTVKTIKQVLSSLISILLPCLADEDREKRVTAGKTLGEVVRKLGQRVLPEIFPILRDGMFSDDALQRQGVSVGLCEIMSVSNYEQIFDYVDQIIPVVQMGLCDEEEAVRETTAETFAQLHIVIGQDAITEIIPELLNKMDVPETKEQALDGLRQIMASKSKVVLPFLIPRLSEPPLTVDNAKALGSMAAVAGAPINRYVEGILAVFLEALSSDELEGAAEVLEAAHTMVLAVDEEGLNDVMVGLTAAAKSGSEKTRHAAISMLAELSANGEQDLEDQMDDLIEIQLKAFADESKDVIHVAWGGLNKVMERVKSDNAAYLNHILSVLREMEAANPGQDVAGFCLPKGIQPLFGLMHSSLIGGTSEAKQTAAKTVAQVVKMTSATALAPFILKFTGGLIRATSDNAGGIKAAMLNGIHALLLKVPAKLKSMLPQLQPTCVKNLKDANRDVRIAAASVLDKLVAMQRRIDPLLTELISGLEAAEDACIPAYMKAIWSTAGKAGEKAKPEVLANVMEAMFGFLDDDNDTYRLGAAKALAATCKHLGEDELDELLVSRVFAEEAGVPWQANAGRASVLHHLFFEAPEKILGEKYAGRAVETIASLVASDNTTVVGTALAAGAVAASCIIVAPEPAAAIRKTVGAAVTDKATGGDIVIMAAEGFGEVGIRAAEAGEVLEVDVLKATVSVLFKVSVTRTKQAAQAAEHAICRLLNLKAGKASLEAYLACLPATDATKFKTFAEGKLERRLAEI